MMIIAQANPEIDPAELAKLYLYLETLRDIAASGKGQFIIVPSDSPYILSVP